MPWCDGCSRFLNPNTVHADGTCPNCGRAIEEPEMIAAGQHEPVGTPWHFKLLVAATIIYLVWRLAQMIGGVLG